MLSTTRKESLQTFDETNLILNRIHHKIYSRSWAQNFFKGWRNYKGEESWGFSPTADKVCLVCGGKLVIAFSATSITFGVLALCQAVDDISIEGRAPIIGHFSEWTMQGLFCLSLYGQILNDLKLSGAQGKARFLYVKAMNKKGLSAEQRARIYEDYLAYQRNTPKASLMNLRTLPQPPKKKSEGDDLLALDQSLSKIYEKLERKMRKISFFHSLYRGWGVMASQKSTCCLTLLKTALFVSGTLLTLELANYSLGIVWSAMQTYEDASSGENPSIGGHSLEWSVETLVLGNAVLYYFKQLANVGRAEIITNLFYKQIKRLRHKGTVHSLKKADRLYTSLREIVMQLPQGIFQIPHWLIYKSFNDEGEREQSDETQ